jgi:arylformamidase
MWPNTGAIPARITVAGHSAGGHLAAQMLACHWPAHAPDLPPDWFAMRLSISGLFDLEPMAAHAVPEAVVAIDVCGRAALPARPACPHRAGGAISRWPVATKAPNSCVRTQLIRTAWGRQRVPVCEALPGLNHFSVLEALTDPTHRLHQLARDLLS